jgi:hypothetical protein
VCSPHHFGEKRCFGDNSESICCQLAGSCLMCNSCSIGSVLHPHDCWLCRTAASQTDIHRIGLCNTSCKCWVIQIHCDKSICSCITATTRLASGCMTTPQCLLCKLCDSHNCPAVGNEEGMLS